MLASELQSRTQKLEKEQRKRAAAARHKAEKERIAAERVRLQKLQFEQEQRDRRLAQAKSEEEARQQRAAELERNKGVVFTGTFTAVPGGEELAKEKGIKRAADKVLLPASVGSDLLEQNAPKNGAMMFEIALPDGARTHAGLLEFTAPEGTVVIPPKVVRCLWGLDSQLQDCHGAVKVSYRALPQGVFCRLQPLASGFHAAVGDEVKHVLEIALKGYCTLTEGDWIQVEAAGTTWQLAVQELKPEAQVSIIDTDLEVEVQPSLETQAKLAAEEEAARQRLQQLAAIKQQEIDAQVAAQEERQRREQQQAAAAAAIQQEIQQKEALLPEQPEAGPATVMCMIRLPNGGRCNRRFRHEDKMKVLFDFVDTRCWPAVAPRCYQLIAQFPRRVFSPHDCDKSLMEAGLNGNQETLLLQPVQADDWKHTA